MNVEVGSNNEVGLVKMAGSMDEQGARELKAQLAKHTVGKSSSPEFDFHAKTRICSSGIGTLLKLHTKHRASGRAMGIKGMSQSRFDLFSRVKPDLVLDITPAG